LAAATSAAATSAAATSAAATSAAATSAADTGLRRVLLPPNLVKKLGAYCLDGSAGGFFYLPAASKANASRLVVTLEGGGECRTATDCASWNGGSGRSSHGWTATRTFPGFSELSSDAAINPDFHDWAKLFLPYCTADMHSGRRSDYDESLGGYFSGHNVIVGSLEHLLGLSDYTEPSDVLVTGSSAGGIGALLHADYFSRAWPAATVKASPACGFFYAGVSSLHDWEAHTKTTPKALGFIDAWDPYVDESCAAATGGNVSACTDAHLALPFISTPLFLRENLYDTAKLANCGLDARPPLAAEQLAYLKQWGAWMTSQLAALVSDAQHNASRGFFAPSCLNHGENLDTQTAPPVAGVALRDAMRAWYFDGRQVAVPGGGGTPAAPPRLIDDCGDLPCTQPGGGRCAHLEDNPLSETCKARLREDCPGLYMKGQACEACVRSHVSDLVDHDCPQQGAPVFAWWCDGNAPPVGHHVCDVSV